MFGAEKLENLNRALRAIEGRAVTVVIARGFRSTYTIVSLLASYDAEVDKAPLITTQRYHADFAKSGMFYVSTFTQDYGNLSLNFEDDAI